MKVWPKNDQLRKVLRHPSNNVAFHPEGPMEWPDDSFTHRRLQDGDVLLKDPNVADKKSDENPDADLKHHDSRTKKSS